MMGDAIEDLKTTWRTLVTYRNHAMEHGDWDIVMMFSSTIEVIAGLLEVGGHPVGGTDAPVQD
jgi:hypothetical protein